MTTDLWFEVPITDDSLDETDIQYFVLTYEVMNAVNPLGVVQDFGHTVCSIVDNDSEYLRTINIMYS